ncbi:MAG: histidine phosphatase family protein [Deltaproteobacteria bacterium]|nr:histidine phosphatase family protein [Deltaproteobacteria bacterium]
MIAKDIGRDRVIPERVRRRKTRLYLLRHGQVVGHEDFRFNGYTDVELTPFGKKQLESLSETMLEHPIHEIYCSDLKRTRIGAEAFARGRGIEPVPMSELREMNLGVLEGLTYQEVAERHPDLFREWREDIVNYRLPGGECFREAAARVLEALKKILEGKEGKNILIVAHGGSNRIVLSHALEMDLGSAFRLEQDFGCMNIIDYFNSWTVVKLVNANHMVQESDL